MNILVDIRSLLDQPYTGVAQYTLNFLNQTLAEDQENNYFLFYNSAKQQNKSASWRTKFDYPNVKIVDFHWPNKLFNLCLKLFSYPKLDKLVEKKIGQKINRVILPNFNFIAFSQNVLLELVSHDLSFEIYPYFFTFKQRLWHKLIQPRKICQRANKIIVHAENTKNDLIKFYKIQPEKIEVKKPPLAKKFLETFNEQEKIRVKEKYQLPNSFVLYLGNLEPRKNLETLIQAFHQLTISHSASNDYLVIAGVGREMFKLKKIVNRLKINEQVKFLGYLPEEDKVALYHLAKLFVFPSFYEGYGYPVVEALACGLPVITSHTSSLTEIENNRIIFINPHDINDLVRAMGDYFK